MNTSKGFTLIELIVVMAVFLFIIGTALAIFISIVSHQRIILAQQELLRQASYAIEYMTKGLRMAGKDLGNTCLGSEPYCANSDCTGYNYALTRYDSSEQIYRGIKFINQSDNNACQEFFLDNSDPQNPILKEIKKYQQSEIDNPVPLTSTNLKINSIGFNIVGAEGDSLVQPRVTISLDIKAQGDENQPSTKVQTTVSQRDLNK